MPFRKRSISSAFLECGRSIIQGMNESIDDCDGESGLATWKILFTQARQKRIPRKRNRVGDKDKVTVELLQLIEKDPWANPPPCEKLVGDLSGALPREESTFSTALVYQVIEDQQVIKVLRMWTHYE